MVAGDVEVKLAAARQFWKLGGIGQIAETATSRVFKAVRSGDEPVVLKILTPYGADEIDGARLLVWYDGAGAARVHDIHEMMILMEWLDGPPLSDLVRAGDDDGAAVVLCGVARALHQPRAGGYGTLTTLAGQFRALFEAGEWLGVEAMFGRAASLAREMLATTGEEVALHGDLHHDNVLGSSRGWLAIDAKGLVGDPAYEFANVFRNPLSAAELVVQPARIDRLASRFAAHLGCSRRRVVAWAAAHAALSACWDRAAGNPTDADLALLPVLLEVLDREPS